MVFSTLEAVAFEAVAFWALFLFIIACKLLCLSCSPSKSSNFMAPTLKSHGHGARLSDPLLKNPTSFKLLVVPNKFWKYKQCVSFPDSDINNFPCYQQFSVFFLFYVLPLTKYWIKSYMQSIQLSFLHITGNIVMVFWDIFKIGHL